MKTTCPRPMLRRSFRRAILTAFLSGLLPLRLICAPATAPVGDADYRITVRSSADQKYTTFSKEALKDHGKTYVIIGLDQVKMDKPLTKPVNETMLLEGLVKVLSTYGFHVPPPGANPQILLRVIYGRSHLHNPYADGTYNAEGTGLVSSGGSGEPFAGTKTVTLDLMQAAKEKTTPGWYEKLERADGEKLYIAVTAWQFPAASKEKPKKVWQTIMLVDDPAMDLNLVGEKMLAAGGSYFDHPIDKEELTVLASVAEGHVKVGNPTVVEPNKSK